MKIRSIVVLVVLGLIYMACSNDDGGGDETGPASIASISNGEAAEGGTITHTVTLANNNDGGSFSVSLSNDSTDNADLNTNLAEASLSNGVTYDAANGELVVPAGVTSFIIAIVTTPDEDDEDDETYTLTVSGQSGTGTITDDDLPVAYFAQVETQTPDGDRLVFMSILSSLDAEIDLADAIELGGASRIRAFNGKLFAFNGETFEVTRYGLNENNDPVEEDKFSLAGLGISNVSSSIAFVSNTRALYADQNIRQFVIWNPTAMEIVNSIPFPEAIPQSAQADRPVVDLNGRVLIGYAGLDFMTFQVTPGATVALIDPMAETVTVATDDTAPAGNVGTIDDMGDYYFTANSYFGLGHNFNIEMQPSPLILRIKNGESEFDPTFRLDGADTNADAYPDILHYTISGTRYVVGAHDDSNGILAENPDGIFGAFSAGWQLWIGNVDNLDAIRVQENEGELFLFAPFAVDGEFYTSPTFIDERSADDPAPLYRINDNGTLEQVNVTVGFIRLVGRIR
ncbi:MAG: hypothetical protein AAGA86_02555 [Bacteroidota bacterium]